MTTLLKKKSISVYDTLIDKPADQRVVFTEHADGSKAVLRYICVASNFNKRTGRVAACDTRCVDQNYEVFVMFRSDNGYSERGYKKFRISELQEAIDAYQMDCKHLAAMGSQVVIKNSFI